MLPFDNLSTQEPKQDTDPAAPGAATGAAAWMYDLLRKGGASHPLLIRS